MEKREDWNKNTRLPSTLETNILGEEGGGGGGRMNLGANPKERGFSFRASNDAKKEKIVAVTISLTNVFERHNKVKI